MELNDNSARLISRVSSLLDDNNVVEMKRLKGEIAL